MVSLEYSLFYTHEAVIDLMWRFIESSLLPTDWVGESYQQLGAITFIKDSFSLAFELPFLKKKCILFIFVVLSVS